MADNRNSSQVLQELDALSHSLYQAHTARRTASLALPRSSTPNVVAGSVGGDGKQSDSGPRTRRMSMSPWRSRKSQTEFDVDDDEVDASNAPLAKQQSLPGIAGVESSEKKGIWNWKPIRALSHIRMQRLSCLFSVEVVAVNRLPPTMNGLRLVVSVRKKETREGAVQTMPARVLQGAADFEETLFVKCHVYCSGGSGSGKPLKFEPRPFLIYAMAIDAPELDFGKNAVDLGLMIKESMEKNLEGSRVRQWDTTLPLYGKAKGGEIMLKLGFQIMEDGGAGIYSQAEGTKSMSKDRDSTSFSFARRHSKASFSVPSPKVTRSESSVTPRKGDMANDLKEIDEFNLDEPAKPVMTLVVHKSEPKTKPKYEPEIKDDLDLPDFDVVEKGVEMLAVEEERKEEEEVASVEAAEVTSSASNEVVKEVVHDSAHLVRLNELDAIAQQIKALESMMIGDDLDTSKAPQEEEVQRLDADEDAVTREFLHMLELEGGKEENLGVLDNAAKEQPGQDDSKDGDKTIYISDLGKGLGPLVQTRDGGYLSAMNPFDVIVNRKDIPKLAMQISKPFIIVEQNQSSGFEVFQRLAAIGSEELCAKLQSLSSMDELMGKTAEQIAFEGMASGIISGRNKEGASSSAAKIVATLKTMATALSEGRKERITTGIWNVREEPIPMDEILALSLQKIEAMAIEALKVQAGVAEEEAPFDVSALVTGTGSKHPLDSAIPPEEWETTCGSLDSATILVVVQLRDPLRRYETVGAPSIAVIQAARVGGDGKNEEGKFKIGSLHVGGLKLSSHGRRNVWDGEKQRLTAMQWLVAYGLGKAGKKKPMQAKGGPDLLWSMSSRVMADMWLKAIRNPDVKLPEQ